jgi:hypothetical protein
MNNDLQWRQWLCASTEFLKEQGHDKKDARFNKIGHRRALSSRWARSVGMWGLASSKEIMDAVGIDVEGTASARGTFDIFKFRHRLWTGPQFTRELASKGSDPLIRTKKWDMFHLALATHAHVRRRMQTQGRRLDGTVIDATRAHFHILPIEVFLYHEVIEHILLSNGFTDRDEWWRLTEDDRRSLWDCAGEPPLVSGLKVFGPVPKENPDDEIA